MGFNSNFDTTTDAALGQWVFLSMPAATTSLGGYPAASTNVANIGNSPTDFTIYASVNGVGSAATDYTVLSIIGATDAAFTTKYVLGHVILGDSALIGTTFGDAPSADRGLGNYAIRCTNVSPNSLESSDMTVCPYIRVAAKTVGATSSLNCVVTLSIGR